MMGKKEEIFKIIIKLKKTTKPRKSTRSLTTIICQQEIRQSLLWLVGVEDFDFKRKVGLQEQQQKGRITLYHEIC